MILRDRNHPSIFLWAMGNEESLQGNPDGQRMMKTMVALSHKLDPTRLVTSAMNQSNAWGAPNSFTSAMDVQGFNYNNGGLDGFHTKAGFQDKFSIGTETSSALSTRGVYTEGGRGAGGAAPAGGRRGGGAGGRGGRGGRGPATGPDANYESAYDQNRPGWGSTAEDWWTTYAARPWVAGGFVWTGFDYRGEPTLSTGNGGWPDISSHFGIMDTCGFAKDNYYYYQANWIDKPMVHILPHWNQPAFTPPDVNVWAYANCEEVELFLNDQSLGRKPVVRTSHEAWVVPYAPGVLVARGYIGGKEVCQDRVETTGPAAAIKLVSDRASIRADGEDVSLITVQIVDAQGRVVPTANDDVTFTVTGGKLLGTGNGDPADHTLDNAGHRPAFNGLAMALVQSTRTAGPITVMAKSGNLTPTALTIDAEAATPRPSVP
jgi:beta-galactosidase